MKHLHLFPFFRLLQSLRNKLKAAQCSEEEGARFNSMLTWESLGKGRRIKLKKQPSNGILTPSLAIVEGQEINGDVRLVSFSSPERVCFMWALVLKNSKRSMISPNSNFLITGFYFSSTSFSLNIFPDISNG